MAYPVDGGTARPVALVDGGPLYQPAGNGLRSGIPVIIGPTDPISDIPVVIEFDHHQVHEGEAFLYSNLTASLGAGSNKDFRINVPPGLTSERTAPHAIIEVVTTAETEVYFYEGMTFSAAGTQRAFLNRNRTRAAAQPAPQTKIYEDPTVSATGTLLNIGLTGSGNRFGSEARSLTEFILAPGDYLFRVTSRAASDKVLVRVELYEDLGV